MRARWIAVLYLGAVVTACGGATAPSASPSVPATPAVASGAAGMVLQLAPADLGCDAMGVPYRSVMIKIEPAAADSVTAVTDLGATLRTFWSLGFVGGPPDDPVVRDPAGQVVATDGERLEIPEGAWPRLHGYFVCPSTNALYVLLEDPA